MSAYGGSATPSPFGTETGTLDFDTDGTMITSPTVAMTWDAEYTESGATFDINMDNLSQVSRASTAIVRSQDGFQSGKLAGYNIAPNGVISLNYNNGCHLYPSDSADCLTRISVLRRPLTYIC